MLDGRCGDRDTPRGLVRVHNRLAVDTHKSPRSWHDRVGTETHHRNGVLVGHNPQHRMHPSPLSLGSTVCG